MKIVNKDEVDTFVFNHRDNGCDGIKGELLDENGLELNIAWRDKVTGEEIKVAYLCDHDKGINDYCLDCGRINNA